MIESKINDEKYIEWQKEFVKGNQFTVYNTFSNSIDEEARRWYYSHQKVYNLINCKVKFWERNYKVNLWGRGGYIDQLIPYQIQYNEYMNQITLLVDRMTSPVLLVEDGSVDIDELSEEGLAPGKILIYRQGSNAPSGLQIKPEVNEIELVRSLAWYVKEELENLCQSIELELMQESSKDKYEECVGKKS